MRHGPVEVPWNIKLSWGLHLHRFKGKILFSDCDPNGRYVCLLLEISDTTFIVTNLYGFNQQKENEKLFYRMEERILSLLNNYPSSYFIFVGDFSVVMDNNIDGPPDLIIL